MPFLPSFLKNIGVGVATEIVRGFLDEQIKNVTPSDIYDAIMHNKDIWGVTPDDTKEVGGKLKKTYGKLFYKYSDFLTTELLLEKWMKKDRPDIYSMVINTDYHGEKLGVLWFDDQVAKIKKKIFQM